MKWYNKNIEIRYADTDQMGVVHHSVHPIYCELSRLHVCKELGLPYPELEEAGYYLMVSEMKFRYHLPIRLSQAIYVRGGLVRLNKRLMEFAYEIRDRDHNRLHCQGTTTHLVTKSTDSVVSLPNPYLDIYRKGLETP